MIKKWFVRFIRKHTEIEWGRTAISFCPKIKIKMFGIVIGDMYWSTFRNEWTDHNNY